jgi:hypothetical protein
MESANGLGRDYTAEVDQARHAAHLLRRGAFLTAGFGVLVCVIAVASMLDGTAEVTAAVEYFLAIGAASIISGVAFYVSSWNLSLSASRLELQLDSSRANARQATDASQADSASS